MILKEEKRFRKSDVDRSHRINEAPFRRHHLLVKCDNCSEEWWAIKNSFIVSNSYSGNNLTKKDYCKKCRHLQDYSEGVRKKPKRQKRSNLLGKDTLKLKQSRMQNRSGYQMSWTNDLNHPRIQNKTSQKNFKGGRVYTHILIMEKFLGRYVHKEECIHHIDGDKSNNKIENLYLCKSKSHHALVHNKMEKFLNSLIKLGLVRFNRDTDEFELTYDVSHLKIEGIEK